MSGFCVAKTEGHPHLCPSDTCTCGKYCKDYEQGKFPPMYPVPTTIGEITFTSNEVVLWYTDLRPAHGIFVAGRMLCRAP